MRHCPSRPRRQPATQAFELNFEQGQSLQTTKFIEMYRTEDHQEALRAFFKKRDGTYFRR